MTQHQPAAPRPYSALPPPPALEFGAERRPWCGRVLPSITLAVAVAAAVMAGIALAQQPFQFGGVAQQPASTSSILAPAPSAAEIAAARKDACGAWTAASTSMVATRQPFLDKTQPGLTWDWNDPVIANALAQAQTGILAQVAYLGQHVPPATPTEVAVPIREFISANVDLIALDGQHQPAAASNAAAGRSNAAAAKIRTACGS
jgi:hypothetical protein